MNKDNLEGTVRPGGGQGEKILGQATNDGTTAERGDHAAGEARSAVGSAKDAVSEVSDAVSSLDFPGLRDEIGKLTQKVSELAQNRSFGRARSRGWRDGSGGGKFVPVRRKCAGQICRN